MEYGHMMDIKEAEGKAHNSGFEESKIDTAKKILEKNMATKDIIEVTGLSKEEIEKLK